jgi:hypothetical protein
MLVGGERNRERSTAGGRALAWWPVLAFLGVVALMVGVLVLIEAHELHISPAAAWRRQCHRVKANTHLPRWARRR